MALQGGGSHGAFTWGVLEALLQDGRFEFAGLSGTSAGGMNAAAVVHGLLQDGDAGAIRALEDFWRQTHELGARMAPMFADPAGKARGDHNLTTAPGMIFRTFVGQLVGSVSPYAANPLNINPFRSVVENFFDFDAIRKADGCKLFLAATHVRTGKIRIFHNREITADTLMATSCVPTMFQAVSVDGEYYWDGGYVANPAIFPLIDECDAVEVVLVPLTSSLCSSLPRQAAEIKERFREITLNACLMREIRAIRLITRLIDDGKITDASMRRINLHVIKDAEAFAGLEEGSALNTDWDFLNALRRAGGDAAKAWIADTYRKLGTRIAFDEATFADYY